MVTKEQALDCFDRVRAFYKGGEKSSNKKYDEKGQNFDDKQKARNAQQKASAAKMLEMGRSYKKFSGRTPLEIGGELHGQKSTLGNCGEMAAVAMHIAVTDVHLNADEVSMATLTHKQTSGKFLFKTKRSFGHTFALLGKGKNDERWVVDPWAGECCKLSEYPQRLKAKLYNWEVEGKRIHVNLEDGAAWVEPTHPMVMGVLDKGARWSEVGARQAGD